MKIVVSDLELNSIISQKKPTELQDFSLSISTKSISISFSFKKGLVSYTDSLKFAPIIKNNNTLIIKIIQPLQKMNKFFLNILSKLLKKELPFDLTLLLTPESEIPLNFAMQKIPPYIKLREINLSEGKIEITFEVI